MAIQNKSDSSSIYTNDFSVKGAASVTGGLVAGVVSGVFSFSKIVQSMSGAPSAAKSLKAAAWGLSSSVGSIALAGAVGYAIYSYLPSSSASTTNTPSSTAASEESISVKIKTIALGSSSVFEKIYSKSEKLAAVIQDVVQSSLNKARTNVLGETQPLKFKISVLGGTPTAELDISDAETISLDDFYKKHQLNSESDFTVYLRKDNHQ